MPLKRVSDCSDCGRTVKGRAQGFATRETFMLKTLKYALLAGVLLALTPQAMAETPADTLVIAKNIDDIISLDPAEAYELTGIEVLANTYDRIMRFEPTDITKLVGGVAESVTVSDDGKTFTFKIRAGQKFASGNPVTAQGCRLLAAARDQARTRPPLFLLSQLGWTKDNVDQMVTAPDDATLSRHDRRGLRAVARLRPALVGRRFGRRHEGGDGTPDRRRLRLCLAQDQFGRLRRLHGEVVEAERKRHPRSQSQLSRRRSQAEARRDPPCSGTRGPAPAASRRATPTSPAT